MNEPDSVPAPSSADAKTSNGPADTSLLRMLRDLESEGYDTQFRVVDGGDVICSNCSTRSAADTVQVDGTRRLEGASDPDDMLAVVLIGCPQCRSAGVVVANYGPESSVEQAEFLRAVA